MKNTPKSSVYIARVEQAGDGDAVPTSARVLRHNAHAVTTSEASQGTKRDKERFVDLTQSNAVLVSAELEFMEAMDAYKKRSGRMFPTWSEVLEVLVTLGYKKVRPTGFDSA
jgi:hypothetical protein